jgi:hypothetical protein
MASKALTARSSSQENKRQDERVLHTEDDSAIQFLLGSFISIDIISCASTRSSPFLGLDHRVMLDSTEIHLESLTGCRNWAMTFIFEISLLDKWKKEGEKANKLSITELTRRGANIEERLRERIANTDISIRASSSNTSRISASTCTEITEIFALTAITYLHVVISGAYPELPEITESVSKTIASFQRLTDPKLLGSLVWPFCVSGCLALDRQHTIFRELVSAAEITPSTIGTCLEAFKIVEECWEMRKSRSFNCDWVSVMNKWGHYVLLC